MRRPGADQHLALEVMERRGRDLDDDPRRPRDATRQRSGDAAQAATSPGPSVSRAPRAPERDGNTVERWPGTPAGRSINRPRSKIHALASRVSSLTACRTLDPGRRRTRPRSARRPASPAAGRCRRRPCGEEDVAEHEQEPETEARVVASETASSLVFGTSSQP